MDDSRTNRTNRATSQPSLRQASAETTCARSHTATTTDTAASAALTAIVRKAQAGDEDALRTLVLDYQRRVAGFVYSITNRTDYVEDLSQIVFIKMIRFLPRLTQPAQFEAWLFRLARNACIDHIRRERWQKFMTPLETEERVLEIPDKPTGINSEELDALNHAISKLKPKDRALIALAQEGRSQVEMAKITGVSVMAIKARLHRAREQLKQYYEHAT